MWPPCHIRKSAAKPSPWQRVAFVVVGPPAYLSRPSMWPTISSPPCPHLLPRREPLSTSPLEAPGPQSPAAPCAECRPRSTAARAITAYRSLDRQVRAHAFNVQSFRSHRGYLNGPPKLRRPAGARLGEPRRARAARCARCGKRHAPGPSPRGAAALPGPSWHLSSVGLLHGFWKLAYAGRPRAGSQTPPLRPPGASRAHRAPPHPHPRRRPSALYGRRPQPGTPAQPPAPRPRGRLEAQGSPARPRPRSWH